MILEKDNILEFNQYMKSNKIPYIIYVDFQSLIKKIDGCANNPEKCSSKTLGENILCGYLMSTIWAFDHIENKHTLYCGENFFTSLKEHATNFEKNKKRAKIIPSCNRMLHTWKKILKKVYL